MDFSVWSLIQGFFKNRNSCVDNFSKHIFSISTCHIIHILWGHECRAGRRRSVLKKTIGFPFSLYLPNQIFMKKLCCKGLGTWQKSSCVLKNVLFSLTLEKERLQMKMCKICESYLNFSINVEKKKSLLYNKKISSLANKAIF